MEVTAAGSCVDDVTTLVGKVCACPCKKQAGRLRPSICLNFLVRDLLPEFIFFFIRLPEFICATASVQKLMTSG